MCCHSLSGVRHVKPHLLHFVYSGPTLGALTIRDPIREQKNISQGEIEKRTGLLRGYISRVEHGHTVPAIETLEKFARALEVPMYQLLYEGE